MNDQTNFIWDETGMVWRKTVTRVGLKVCPFCFHKGKKSQLTRVPTRYARVCNTCHTEFSDEFLADYKFFDAEGKPNLTPPPTIEGVFINHQDPDKDIEAVRMMMEILFDD